jgi:hypothetical protein
VHTNGCRHAKKFEDPLKDRDDDNTAADAQQTCQHTGDDSTAQHCGREHYNLSYIDHRCLPNKLSAQEFMKVYYDRQMAKAKKLKNEKALLREALDMIMTDAVKRGIVEFEATDSQDLKVQYAYRLLVHDKEIAPLPHGQDTLPKIRHRLAMWVTHKLPEGHELL